MKDLKDIIQENLLNEGKVNWYIWKEKDVWKGTTAKNYESGKMDPKKCVTYDGCKTEEEVLDFLDAFFDDAIVPKVVESLVNQAKEKFYIWQENKDWYGTNEKNQGARIKNAREILTFAARNGFETTDDVKEYIKKYFKVDLDVEVLDKRP